MADTLENVTLLPGVWVDLYDATGIPVGNQIIVQNLGGLGTQTVYLCEQLAAPTDLSAYNVCKYGEEVINSVGATGAWAYSAQGAKINVRVV